jgi:hypothetical protein
MPAERRPNVAGLYLYTYVRGWRFSGILVDRGQGLFLARGEVGPEDWWEPTQTDLTTEPRKGKAHEPARDRPH